MQYILNYDKKRYVYMRDVHKDHLLFAVLKDQHDVYLDVLNKFNSEPNEVPDDYSLEVIQMTEVSDDIYSLDNFKTLRYPIRDLFYALAFPLGSSISA
jgi:hypothetical protein